MLLVKSSLIVRAFPTKTVHLYNDIESRCTILVVVYMAYVQLVKTNIIVREFPTKTVHLYNDAESRCTILAVVYVVYVQLSIQL